MLLKITDFDDEISESLKRMTGKKTASKAAEVILNSYLADCENHSLLEEKYENLQDSYEELESKLSDIKSALKILKEL